MQTRHFYKLIAILFFPVLFSSCKKSLDETVYSELSPDNFLTEEKGLSTVLTSAYSSMQYLLAEAASDLHSDMVISGQAWGRGGAWEAFYFVRMRNYTWDATGDISLVYWNKLYKTILYCNTVLDNIDGGNFSTAFKDNTKGEALAIRGYSYWKLFSFFGPTAIFTTANSTDLMLPKATEAQMKERIEQDLLQAIDLLPVTQGQFGRFTKGAALSVLCKYYLNTKQWEKCLEYAQKVIDLNQYQLQPDYQQLFSLTNENNNEVIFVFPREASPQGVSTNLVALTLPPDYPRAANIVLFPAILYVFDSFVDQFEATDTRANFFVKSYVNTAGVNVVGYGKDQTLTLKYALDPKGSQASDGNDIKVIRYADILLSKAEALNELNGPTQEAVDLVNQIRNRAQASPITLGLFTKDTFRDFILKERGMELFFEGKRREDMIRHGKLISDAQARGIANAQPFHVLYPIPQVEIDANPNMEQNDGY